MAPSKQPTNSARLERGATSPLSVRGPSAQVAVEDGAQGVVVLEEGVTDLTLALGVDAVVHVLGLWHEGSAALQATLQRGARVHWHIAHVSPQGSVAVTSTLAGDDARCDVDAIAVAGTNAAPRIAVINEYNAKRGAGEIAMRVVAAAHARGTCTGMIRIGEHGGGTDTYLAQRALLLAKDAAVDALPALEIRTNDVKASHGATVTRVTDIDLFSFAARGIPPAQARQLFVEGFLRASVEGAPATEEWSKRVLASAAAALQLSA